jgi:hypothetical protein|tara:strand:+ start:38546 stop:39142 length:597 start_codon:yes stop_codon:yes gene_type:complete
MKIKFFYSIPYDRMLTLMSGLNYSEKQSLEMKKYLKNIEVKWKKVESKVTKEIEKVSKLKFQNDSTCFLVKNMDYLALSNPLTIKIIKDSKKFIDNIIHELTHIILVQNVNSKKLLQNLNVLYPNKDSHFKAHLPSLLIEKGVIENLFGKKYYSGISDEYSKFESLGRMNKDIESLHKKFHKSKLGILGFFENEVINR